MRFWDGCGSPWFWTVPCCRWWSPLGIFLFKGKDVGLSIKTREGWPNKWKKLIQKSAWKCSKIDWLKIDDCVINEYWRYLWKPIYLGLVKCYVLTTKKNFVKEIPWPWHLSNDVIWLFVGFWVVCFESESYYLYYYYCLPLSFRDCRIAHHSKKNVLNQPGVHGM